MHRVILALACLAFTSLGRRISSSESLKSPDTANRQEAAEGLAKLLMASNRRAAFNPSGTGALAGSRHVSAPRMSMPPARSAEKAKDLMVEAPEAAEMDLARAEEFSEEFDASTLAVGLAALAGMIPAEALAKGGAFGIWEGRIVSLAHPTIMALMYACSAFAAYTGYNWRRLRELGTEVQDLKKERKALEAKLDAAPEDEPPEKHQPLRDEVAALTTKIDEMTATRKELSNDNLKDKHWLAGSIILGLGTSFAIEGPVNTFLRAQKLFPGPHLYAGAGCVVCWALAASLVPQMQKGKDFARNAHIAINLLAFGLFTWQLPTGWEITLKVIKFTKFP